ncbi:MAG TPA: hypothetical protein VHD55_00840 [Candidatus Paceibacterota bacterium]|nr:hypothetical protein [Candidatus Paceibacterota bacterium]
MERKILILIGTLAALVLIAAAYAVLHGPQGANGSAPGSKLVPYISQDLGIAFAYPARYELSEDVTAGGYVLTLGDKEALAAARAREVSEGPPTIAIAAVQNPDNLSLDEWVKQAIEANSSATDQEPASTILAGEPALKYRLIGLYDSDATALIHNGRIYVFSVAWLTPADSMVKDFEQIIKSVTFI